MTSACDKRKTVWLDCDPGHDDALAIMLACTHPSLNLVGVSTVACNQTVDKTTANAAAVLRAAGAEAVPVFRGQAKPLLRPGQVCAEIHGETGLDAPEGGRLFPDSPVPMRPEKAPLAIADAVRRHLASNPTNPFQLICTGALTNAALFISLFPELPVEISIMGGALGVGNTGPVQEFNIQTDPEAAKIVFESGLKVTMVPIEVTHTLLATPGVVERIESLATPFSAQIVKLLHFFAATYREVFKFDHPPVHDPVAVAYVIDPSLFQCKRMRVDVEVGSELCAGQTVCDVWQQSKRPVNVNVAMSVDVVACWELIVRAIEAANTQSPLNR